MGVKAFEVLIFALLVAGCTASPTGNAVQENTDCSSLTLVFERAACYTEIAAHQEDASVCEKILDSTSGKNDCLTAVAQATKNPVLCEDVEGNNAKMECYATLAALLDDSKICNNLEEGYFRDACYAGRYGHLNKIAGFGEVP